MPGTILLDDLRDSVEDQLHQHVQGLLDQASQAGQQAQQVVQQVQSSPGLAPTPPAIQLPSASDVQAALMQHVDSITQPAVQTAQPALQVLGQGQQAAGGALTELGGKAQQVQNALLDHVNSITQGAQSAQQDLTSPPQATQAPTVLGGDQGLGGAAAPPTTQAAATPPPAPDRSMSLQEYARAAAQRAGIDPDIFTAQIQQESGFDPKARSGAGAIGIAQFMPGTAAGMGVDPTDPYAALDGAAKLDAQNLKKYDGDYAKTLAAYNAGGGAVDQYGGVPPYKETQSYVSTILNNAKNAVGGAVQAAGQRIPGPVGGAVQQAGQDISQFGDSQLTSAEAYAACGPAAAVRFAERFGRNPTLREATDMAKQVGWTQDSGMAGLSSEQKLMTNLGVDTKIVGRDWSAFAKEAQTGNPVTISTPGHYYYADAYNPESGAFHVGRSGLDLKGGSEWMTPSQMENLMGTAQGALFSNNPNVPAKGSTTTSNETPLGGPAGTQPNAPVTLGGQSAKPVQYVHGAMQDAAGNTVADQQAGPTPIQTAQDVLGQAAGAVGGAVGGAASALGTAAQGALGAAQGAVQGAVAQATAPVQLPAGQVSARDEAGQVANDLSNAARGVVEATPPVLGAAAGQARSTAQDVLGLPKTPEEAQTRDAQYQRDVMAAAQAMNQRAAEPLTIGGVAGDAWNTIVSGVTRPAQGISLGDYQQSQATKNQWIEQNNPAKDVLLLGGVTTGIAQQLTDPAMLVAFGPTLGAGRAVGTAAGGRVVAGLTDRLAPRAVEFAATVADKLASGAIVGGVQNALMEAEKPEATPESVFTALWQGAGFGAGADLIGAAATPMAKRIGQTLIDQAPRLGPAVSTFLRDERGTLTLPSRDVLHGQAVPRPGYEPGTPEHTTDQFLQDQARVQGTSTPTITGDQIRAQPGMGGSLSRGLQEVRDATEAGLPAARWYQQIVQQVRQDTGQDINPREAAVLMGATGGNAGVQANYHAMLSVFDAMRQAKPDLAGLENLDLPQIQATGVFKDVQALVRGDKAYIDDDMLAKVMRGYRTGEVPVPSGAKLSSYTQDFLHALSESYSPYSTQDVHQGRLFGARPDIQPGGKPLPDVSQNDQAYRTMHALTNWVGREMNLPPDQAQAAAWTTFRTLWTDPTIGPKLQNDTIGLSDAIAQGKAAGLLNPQALATGGLAEVTGPRTGPPTSWSNKINDVRDRIQQNGSYNAPPPAGATALNDIALYHPSIQSALQKRTILDPSGFEYGTVSGPKTGVRRPVGNEPAVALRDLARADQPVIRVPGELQVDPTTGKIPWLAVEHDVQQTANHAYVTVPGIGDDAAHLIGQRLGADRFNHATYGPNETQPGGISVDGLARAEQQAIARALQAQGLPVISEAGGNGLRVPLMEGKLATLAKTVQDTVSRESTSGTLLPYTGATHAIKSTGSGGARGVGNQGGGAAGPLGIPTRNGVRGQQLAQAVFRDAGPGAEGAATEAAGGPGPAPTGGGLRGTRQRAESTPAFGVNLGSAALGGLAGNAATPQDSPLDVRLKNIGLGLGTGLLGGHLITRGGAGSLLERAVAGDRGAIPGEAGFRAPEVGREAPRPGEGLLATTTREPPGGGTGGLSDVASNPHLLREAGPGETPMTLEERSAHGDTLEQRYQANQDRLAAIDEQLRNPGQKPERPLWAAGFTNDQVAQMAAKAGYSPFEPLWWEKAGLDAGSGEVREMINESGIQRGARDAGRVSTPAELRAEQRTLQQDQAHLEAAGEQQATAPDNARFVKPPERTPAGELPFSGGGANDAGAQLAQEVVTKKGRLASDENQVVATDVGSHVTGRGIVNPAEVVREPPTEATARLMPNLSAIGKDMPETVAQIQKSAEDNPQLWEHYRQGTITFDSLKNDLANRVGMTVADWNKTRVGQAFNDQEMVALQAAMIEEQARQTDMAKFILAKGGVEALTPEELAYSMAHLTQAQTLAAVAKGAGSTVARSLNARKISFDRQLASSITAQNELKAAQRIRAAARRDLARPDATVAQKKAAQKALVDSEAKINAAADAETQRTGQQAAKAQKLLESMGGVKVTKDVLKNYIEALSDPNPMVAAKFLQATGSMSNWKRATIVRLAGLVSSPITQMVNIGGNVSGAVMEVPTRALVVGIDALRAAATGGERQAYTGEILPMLKAYGPGFLGQWDNAVQIMRTGITPEQLADPTKIRGAFSGSEKLNFAVEAPLRALGAADALFRGGAMAAHSARVASRQAIREGFSGPQVAGRAASIVKNLEDYPELAQEAADATARQVYQERRAGLGGGNQAQPDVKEFAVKQFLPFYQTPMNITAQGGALSPFGLIGAGQSALKARGMSVGTAAERSAQGRETLLAEERAARAIIGSAILGGGLALGGAGMLTGAYPVDPREASTLPQGWRPWSLRVTSPVDNNTYYVPMQNLGPAGFPMAMAAILTDPQHRGKTLADGGEQLNAATAIGRYVLDNTFLQGMQQVVDTLHDPKTAAQKFGESLAASYGPYSSLGREFQRMAGVASRNPHSGFVGLGEALEANYPGLSGNVPEATTPLGEPRTQAATGIGRVLPLRYDIERDTPLLQQLRESGVGIPTEHKSLNYGGQHIDLNEDEQDVLKRQRGEALKQYLDPYVNDPKFQNLTQAERNRYLTVLVSHAVQYADHQFLNSMPGADLSSRLKPKTVADPYYLGDAGAAA